MIQKDNVIILMHLFSSLEDSLKELEKAQDGNDYNKFNSLKNHLNELQKEILKNLEKEK